MTGADLMVNIIADRLNPVLTVFFSDERFAGQSQAALRLFFCLLHRQLNVNVHKEKMLQWFCIFYILPI